VSNTISELKSDTARINGAKSNGPVTPEGKARSSANSRKHGLTSASIMLPDESAEHYQLLLADYMDRFQPQDGVEADLVETMVAARWRLRRLLEIEAHQFKMEIIVRKKRMNESFTNLEREDHLALAFQNMSHNNGPSLTLILRYEAQINRSYNKALEQLQKLQATRPPAPPPAPSEAPVGSFGNPDADPHSSQEPGAHPQPDDPAPRAAAGIPPQIWRTLQKE